MNNGIYGFPNPASAVLGTGVDFLTNVINNRVTDYSYATNTTKTISAKHATIRSLNISSASTLTVSQGLQGIGVLHVFGDLLVNDTSKLILKNTLLIVYGNVYGTGTIKPPDGANGGNGGSPPYTGETVYGTDGAASPAEYGGAPGGAYGGAPEVSRAGGGGGGAGLTSYGSTGAGGKGGGYLVTRESGLGYGAGGGGGSPASTITGGGGVGPYPYYINAGGNGGGTTGSGTVDWGGGGGGSGGWHLNMIVFGTISSSIIIRGGIPGYGGTSTYTGPETKADGGTAGDLNLWSKYTSNPGSCTASKVVVYGNNRDGANGTMNFNSLDTSNLFGLVNNITKNPLANTIQDALQLGWLFWTKQGATW